MVFRTVIAVGTELDLSAQPNLQLLPTSPQRRTEPHCGREILFPINIEAGMPLPQWGRLVGSFNHNSPPY